jgi:hypothetical protein
MCKQQLVKDPKQPRKEMNESRLSVEVMPTPPATTYANMLSTHDSTLLRVDASARRIHVSNKRRGLPRKMLSWKSGRL